MQLQNRVLKNSIKSLTPENTATPQGLQPILPVASNDRTHAIAIEESDWVRRVQEGDLVAFDLLMTRYRSRALRLATHVLHNAEEAEDVVQEAFVRIYTQIREYRGEARFYTWFYKIVLRCCLNRLRIPYWRREKVFLEEIRLPEVAPSKQSDTVEARMLVEQLLGRLTPPLRAAFVLRELEGLDYLEIAELLEIPVGTVRSRLSTAREQFRYFYQCVQKETQDV